MNTSKKTKDQKNNKNLEIIEFINDLIKDNKQKINESNPITYQPINFIDNYNYVLPIIKNFETISYY